MNTLYRWLTFSALTFFLTPAVQAQSWESSLKTADSLSGLRDYEGAVAKYLEAATIRDSLKMNRDSVHAYILHSAGACYARIWQFTLSRQYIKQSLALREELFPAIHPQIAASLVVLAYVTADGSYQEADDMYKRALSIFDANLANGSSDTLLLQQYAGALVNTGLMNSNYGKYKEALGYYDKALATYKASTAFESEPVAKLLNQIGNVYWYANDFETAGKNFEEALAIHRKTVGPFDRDLAMSLNNLAAVYNKLGRYAEAGQYLQESIHIKEQLYGATSGQVANGLINLAFNYARQGRFDEAKPLHQRGSLFKRQNVGPYAKEYGLTLEGASSLYRAWGDYDSSIYFAEAAVDLRKRMYKNLSVVFSEKDILSHSVFLRNAVDIALSAYVDHPHPEVRARAITHIIGGKEHVADELWTRRELEILDSDTSLHSEYGAWKTSLGELSRAYASQPAGSLERHLHRIDSLAARSQEIETRLVRMSASFRSKIETEAITAESLARALPAKTTLVEFKRFNYKNLQMLSPTPRYIVGLISNTGTNVVMLERTATIDSLVAEYRSHLTSVAELTRPTGSRETAAFRGISARLYDLLWRPIARFIPAGNTLLIAPDGGLYLLAFASLMNTNGTFLVEQHPLHYLSAGRDLLRILKPQSSGTGLAVFGDPDYNATVAVRQQRRSAQPISQVAHADPYAVRNVRSGCGALFELQVTRLAETGREATNVARLWKKEYSGESAEAFTRQAASEEQFKSSAPGRRTLHVSTHGYFLQASCKEIAFSENPLLQSGLLLAGANLHGRGADSPGAEDGILTALEVSAMDLRGTDLVVLSACETGLGKVEQGEGVYGLRRAFQMAGAKTVVSSLWKVPDKETMQFMRTLYSTKAKTYPELMQQVALKRIREARLRGRPTHPFTWGAFVATGDWRVR